MPSRRDFLRTAGAGLGAAALGPAARPARLDGAPYLRPSAVEPVAIASANGLGAVRHALETIHAGGDTLQAVIEGVNLVELDPDDTSVGYGGLPNEDGVVQLDSSVMHGPSRGAGAVAALEGVKTPSRVAVAVMRHTDHVLLVGEGAQQFARRMGFEIHDTLLTPQARARWLRWKAAVSDRDDWLDPAETGLGDSEFLHTLTTPAGGSASGNRTGNGTGGQEPETAMLESYDGVRPWGTINCNAVDPDGNLSGVTTTSGLAWKIPGRVGDSPIIGAGLYVDNDVGAAGSTGRGEAVIKTLGSHTVVELMRQGASPTDAALEALRRIVRFTEAQPRLQREDGRPAFNVNYYAVDRTGDFGAAAIWPGRYAVAFGDTAEIRDSAHLFER
ncbi:MAG: twin-arginine translocation signal domain-containing protein [Gemmatimonadetes bacterium]|nr:N(4)-(beta-N-acetylglucosaminyl)-L-asparaginase [Gemmatimonadota bacterium]NIQ55119.1 N(4)-(beta-N-acetylglucosaminyl)-L-asparaginase [Gemmatimonadota bacterium]NIU75315.1 twin-arginine translocation signal domain-containing protein [Gammaproteobacteria bacterium]NIX45098.1 twin-arginine translocation signal domain-containing protein [Gemmatimonadota bacterium]NIY09351.1 twin-arginine translocation signal domain-containing protein [Gemmatimonadota bacterium]